MESKNGNDHVLLHYWCDYAADTIDFTLAQAFFVSEFPYAKIVYSALPNKKGATRENAMILKKWLHQFPEGFIHICHLNLLSSEAPRFMITFYKGQYFIGPDNGLMQLAFEDPSVAYYIVPNNSNNWDFLKDVFIPCLKTLLAHPMVPLHELFKPKENLSKPMWLQPIVKNNSIRINCMYVDSYGNCYFNLTKDTFESYRQNRNVKIRNQIITINNILNDYNDIPEGKILALFGHGDLLQIAQNGGHCSTSAGIYVDTPILIEFHD